MSEIATFANGLLRDYQSIENAISLSWSNGPVEGNVLKVVIPQFPRIPNLIISPQISAAGYSDL
ncbi:hypothetical protein [Pedobacter heparinus]|uniref:hypothetical protein n=1 Tax=Pedobacter heparinus TaxID=984 RepID=UPI00292F88A7|nr:hypothetical protein [Pedobacter heparinus]